MSLKNFEEEYLFTKYKDKNIINAKTFKGKVSKYKNIDASRLYTRIVNYQIKKYGEALSGIGDYETYIPTRTKQVNSYKRKSARNKQRGIGKSAKLERWIDHE